MLHAAMHAGNHQIIKLMAPSMHCSMKHVTIDVINELIIFLTMNLEMYIHEVKSLAKKVLMV